MKPENDMRYTEFVRTLVQTRLVYTLQDSESFFAECPSEAYDDEFGEPVPVYCVWDNAADAQACCKEEWADYRLEEWPLEDFMTEVLIESDQVAALMGVAFDENLFGTEIEPIELLADLLDEIRHQNAEHFYPRFRELQDYRLEWELMMQGGNIVH